MLKNLQPEKYRQKVILPFRVYERQVGTYVLRSNGHDMSMHLLVKYLLFIWRYVNVGNGDTNWPKGLEVRKISFKISNDSTQSRLSLIHISEPTRPY